MTSETYPSGRLVTTVYDSANRPYTATGSLAGQQTSYWSVPEGATPDGSPAYWPHGEPKFSSYGNNLWRQSNYNSRLQPTWYQDAVNNSPGSIYFQVSLGWRTTSTNNNGNLTSATYNNGGPGYSQFLTISQTYTYDTVNRINAVFDTNSVSNWWEQFGIDQYGNAWVARWGGPAPSGNLPTSNVYSAANNQIIGSGCYDAAGNQLLIPCDLMTNDNVLAYDAENRVRTETDGTTSAVTTYGYDGDGHRVQKSGSAGQSVYVYDAMGQLAAEYSTNPAVTPPCTTCYLSYDHLGSVRLVTDQNANVVSRHDYMPFGGEIPGNTVGRDSSFGAPDNVSQRFTGKERDSESGLDYFGARYYGSVLGRFTSPDPKGVPDEFDNPQAWNKYAYTGNNPLRYTDPDGKDWKDVVAGAFNAFTSDNAFGAGRQSGNSDFRTGQAVGDGAAFVQGGVQMIAGAAGDVGGTLLDLTGVGALIGVPAQAVSTAVGLDGVGVAGTAAGNLITQASAIGPKEGVSGGPGGGKRVSDQTKAAALDENSTANGGQAKCVFCGDPVGEGTGNKINYDHANPKSQNGSGTDLGNVNVACEYCNKSKGPSPAPKNPKYPDQQ